MKKNTFIGAIACLLLISGLSIASVLASTHLESKRNTTSTNAVESTVVIPQQAYTPTSAAAPLQLLAKDYRCLKRCEDQMSNCAMNDNMSGEECSDRYMACRKRCGEDF